MNKHLSIAIFLLLAVLTSTFGQTKIEKYCQVLNRPKGTFSFKSIFSIYLGEQSNLFNFKDSLVIHQFQKVNELTSELDVLNYMASIGWTFVNIPGGVYFKKEFDTSELINNTN